ncbi:MAG: hypothetical protein RI897_2910 [Verrucomicrobiota bacterium]
MDAATQTQAPLCPNELRQHVSQLTRGLSCLFWGLPISLVLAIQTLTSTRIGNLGPASALAPSASFLLLLYGLLLLGKFHRHHLPWTQALERTRLLALTNLGLSPFLHWYQRVPDSPFFAASVGLLALFYVAFLLSLTGSIRQLALLLPDPLLQVEVLAFSRLIAICLLLLPCIAIAWTSAIYWSNSPLHLRLLLQTLEPFRILVFLFLTLLPLSITMSLLWKCKETILGLTSNT